MGRVSHKIDERLICVDVESRVFKTDPLSWTWSSSQHFAKLSENSSVR